MRKILSFIPNQFIIPLFILGGLVAGVGGYTVYMSRAYSYLSNDPAVCVNCHIMAPYYASWNHSSHAIWATCNDCHVPQNNIVSTYMFKAEDGLYHAAVFTVNGEPEVIRPRDGSYAVIMENCIRCHTQLNTEFVKTGMATYADVKAGEAKACWDCHTQVPHTNISNVASAPGAIAPLPASPVPQWLKELM
ncbi:cytochrome c nitrite reductase small subunit [Deltaproteobacteria bacterium Smac51]|nr:cytochrome c nitrite reductase small subunit [Deltaproteobacteria bacterium Smac51]